MKPNPAARLSLLFLVACCLSATQPSDAFSLGTTPIGLHRGAPASYGRSSPSGVSLDQRLGNARRGASCGHDMISSKASDTRSLRTTLDRPNTRYSTTTPSSTSLSSSLMDPVVLRAGMGATAKLLSSIALGGVAATKRFNVLDGAAVSALSRLTYWIFQPAFLLCSVSTTFVTAAASASSGTSGLPGRFLALMPLVAAIQIVMGALLGKVVCKLGGITDESGERSQVQMCTTFGNSGPLPLIFSEALFAGKGTIFRDVAACISFYLLVWSPLFWSFGRVILGTYNSSSASGINGLKPTAIQKVRDEVKKFLSPPVIGSILGVLIGTIPVLRSTFFGGFATPLFGAIATLGTAYLPAALLVLAGSLVGTNKSKEVNVETADVPKVATTIPSVKSIVSIFLSRFLMAPSLSFLTLTIMSRLGLLGAAGTRARAVVSFCILAEGCMPPAQNSVIMLQLEGLKERATSMAKLLTILYALGVVPVTILLSMCLGKSGILAFQ